MKKILLSLIMLCTAVSAWSYTTKSVTKSYMDCENKNLTYVAQKAATCTESGYAMNHWHCSDCGKNFEDEACTKQITDDVVIPAINHKNKTFTDYVAPTTEAEGNVAYWYCPDCEKHFRDAECTKELTEWKLAKLVNMIHLDFKGTSVPVETDHYMNTAIFNFTEDGDVILTVNGKSVTYDKEMIEKVKFSNGTPTVTISANEDPNNNGDYYTTFYSSLEAYTIPEGVTAYTATLDEKQDEVIVLNKIKGGVVPAKTAVVLISASGSYSANTSDYTTGGGTETGILKGTDVEIPVPDGNCYILSGTSTLGMGLYPWTGEGKKFGANKAYLSLGGSKAKAFIFQFNDGGTTGIREAVMDEEKDDPAYNLNGIRVNDNYKGIVIKNGKKTLMK